MRPRPDLDRSLGGAAACACERGCPRGALARCTKDRNAHCSHCLGRAALCACTAGCARGPSAQCTPADDEGDDGGADDAAAVLRGRHVGRVKRVIASKPGASGAPGGQLPHGFLTVDAARSRRLCDVIRAGRAAHGAGAGGASGDDVDLSFQLSDVLPAPGSAVFAAFFGVESQLGVAELEALAGQEVTFEAAWSVRHHRYVALRVQRAMP